ncbi:MAG: hypothetical protein J2P28_24345 [Actinobacteria bacterium]|nr:hypothetical protein [Actinomycetota bacterium]
MYERVTSATATPDHLDDAVHGFEQKVVPALRQLPGYLGAVLDINRDTGQCWARTYWESLAALNASEQGAPQRRQEATGSMKVSVTDVDRYEIAMLELPPGAPPPGAGAVARINDGFTAAPEKLDALIGVLRDRAQSILGQRGCQAMIVAVNRATGRYVAASVWDTRIARRALRRSPRSGGTRARLAGVSQRSPWQRQHSSR